VLGFESLSISVCQSPDSPRAVGQCRESGFPGKLVLDDVKGTSLYLKSENAYAFNHLI
jgi:hypothetical protein